MRSEGYGKDYRYAHGEKDARAKQTHLPEPLLGKRFYRPRESGYERQLKERLDQLNADFE
jgi:putative ATPase